MNNLQFAILLATLLFGGHLALHRWDIRQTRRSLLLRACKAPEHVARAWVEGQESGKAPKLWLQFTGGQPQTVAQGNTGCAAVSTRLRAAGVTVDASAIQQQVPHT
ncbi:hypothetical protein [Hydrogenophaga sp. PAMC20947]|uniref:hypothetical protein n=1 Tax=Hydrogenophaga sp. PAMC20947 TaxID=2565558 RepID=UPI00109DB3D6|nr:hypothetical protein [Hydrogenophaga sp. PAMC20947]QCB48362.1 hypothetical protein E5678_21440 [Hydrogenophaga sp. PAMC20947]